MTRQHQAEAVDRDGVGERERDDFPRDVGRDENGRSLFALAFMLLQRLKHLVTLQAAENRLLVEKTPFPPDERRDIDEREEPEKHFRRLRESIADGELLAGEKGLRDGDINQDTARENHP